MSVGSSNGRATPAVGLGARTGGLRRPLARGVRWWRRLGVSLRRAVAAYNAGNCASYANAIAYNALLALVPLAVFLLALAGVFLQDPATQERVRNALLDNLPITTASGRTQLQDTLTALAHTRPALGIVSLALAAYAARGVVMQLRTGLSVAFGIQRRRSLLRGVLFDLGMAVGLLLLLLLSLALTLAITVAQTADAGLLGRPLPPPVATLLALVYAAAPILVSLLVFGVLYTVVAHAVLTWREVLPGALLAALAFEALKVGFAQYAARVSGANPAYGALGVAVAFLALPHFGAQIALFGAAFARVYRELRTEPPATGGSDSALVHAERS